MKISPNLSILPALLHWLITGHEVDNPS